MYISSNTYGEMPPRLYRGCEEIRKDISEISDELRNIEGKLTVRNVLMELITSADKSDPKVWIPILEDIAYDARESLEKLNSFSERIDELREELIETKCALGY